MHLQIAYHTQFQARWVAQRHGLDPAEWDGSYWLVEVRPEQMELTFDWKVFDMAWFRVWDGCEVLDHQNVLPLKALDAVHAWETALLAAKERVGWIRSTRI